MTCCRHRKRRGRRQILQAAIRCVDERRDELADSSAPGEASIAHVENRVPIAESEQEPRIFRAPESHHDSPDRSFCARWNPLVDSFCRCERQLPLPEVEVRTFGAIRKEEAFVDSETLRFFR